MTRQPLRPRRRGYTLTELMVSLLASSLLLTGMSGSIYIASQAFEGSSAPRERNQAADDPITAPPMMTTS